MDVSHELGALRFVVDSPLSSKVAMFNQHVNQHKQAQLLNPFSNADGRASPKPSFSKDEYGKPLAGSLTEMRGQKANIHVLKEMLELCQIIDSEGYNVKDEPTMRVIPFGELFNIYNYISDKVVGILLRARKHKLVEFEGEMLFQRRDDDVPIFLLKPIHEIRRDMEDKIDSIKRCGSPAPQATSVLLDKKAYGLDVPKGASPRSSVSRTPSPQTSKASTPLRDTKDTKTKKTHATAKATNPVVVENKPSETSKPAEEIQKPKEELPKQELPQQTEAKDEIKPAEAEVVPAVQPTTPVAEVFSVSVETPTTVIEIKTDVNNNSNVANNDLPTIIIEASAVYERPAETKQTSETTTSNTVSASSEPSSVQSSAPVESTASA